MFDGTECFTLNFIHAHPKLLCAVHCVGDVFGVWGGAGSKVCGD
jgi:hypothetical protein